MTCNNSCAVASPKYGIVGRQGCHALLIPVQSLLLSTGLCGGKMSSINSCAVSSPSYRIGGTKGCHALTPV